MEGLVRIDGSLGEGGGQILRTALALGAVYGRPVEIGNVRAGRATPGLRHQHVACLKAAAEVCGAEVEGDEVGSLRVAFRPNRIRPGVYRFEVGTAGSVTLVAQTVLPILLSADGASTVTIVGGTHVPPVADMGLLCGNLSAATSPNGGGGPCPDRAPRILPRRGRRGGPRCETVDGGSTL